MAGTHDLAPLGSNTQLFLNKVWFPLHYSVGKGQSEILLPRQVSKHNPIFTVLAWPRAALLRQTKVRWGESGVYRRKTVPPHPIPALMSSLGASLLPDVPRGLSPFLPVPQPFIVLSQVFSKACTWEVSYLWRCKSDFPSVTRTTLEHFVLPDKEGVRGHTIFLNEKYIVQIA